MPKSNPFFYAFGSAVLERSWSDNSKAYRYGFNGKEKDFETGNDNYDFGARIYDGRLGRWMSVDAYFSVYCNLSIYQTDLNNPICYSDEDGNWVRLKISRFWKDKDGNLHKKNWVSFRKTSHKEIDIIIYNLKIYFFGKCVKDESTKIIDYDDDGNFIRERPDTKYREANENEKELWKESVKQELIDYYNNKYLTNVDGNKTVKVNISFGNEPQVINDLKDVKKYSLRGRPDDLIIVVRSISMMSDVSGVGLTISRNLMVVDFDQMGKGTVAHEFAHQRKLRLPYNPDSDHNERGVFEEEAGKSNPIIFINVWDFRKKNSRDINLEEWIRIFKTK